MAELDLGGLSCFDCAMRLRFSAPGLLLLILSGCGGSTCPESFYDGKATDEAWRSMLDAEARAKKDPAKAVTFFNPLDGQKLPSSGLAPTFNWTSPLTASRPRAAGGTRSLLALASALLYSSAWAHGAPVTGAVHLLRMTVPEQTCPLEVTTTRSEWIPSGEAWNQLKATGGKLVSLDVFSAWQVENRITEGPYRLPKPLTFTMTP